MQTKLRRETLAQQVAHHLLDYIERQGLAPGAFLPSEARLAEEFGVSRPSIREALKALEARGVVEIANGRGATVKAMSSEPLSHFFRRTARVNREALLELLEVRRGLEAQSARLAARRRTAADLAAMARVVATMRQQLGDPEAYTDLDTELHLLIARASGNATLYHLVESIREPLQDTIREGLRRRNPGHQYERVQAMHEDLLAALERGDAEEAARAMAVHFDETMSVVGGDSEERPPQPPTLGGSDAVPG